VTRSQHPVGPRLDRWIARTIFLQPRTPQRGALLAAEAGLHDLN
jgi:hypothetical protein